MHQGVVDTLISEEDQREIAIIRENVVHDMPVNPMLKERAISFLNAIISPGWLESQEWKTF